MPKLTKTNDKDKANADSGITGGAFFGLLFAMLLVGAALGGVGFMGWKRYQEKRGATNAAGGLGVSVKFMRHKDEDA